MTKNGCAANVMRMRRLISPIGVLVILAGALSAIAWLLLNKGYDKGEVAGPAIFVNGVLITALLFAIPAAWYEFERLKVRFDAVRSRWAVAATTLAACYLLTFAVFATGLFFAADRFISFTASATAGN